MSARLACTTSVGDYPQSIRDRILVLPSATCMHECFGCPQAAAQRCLEFMCARFADPLYTGDYPQSVKDRVPSLPTFTAEQQAALRGSADFFLINNYSTKYASHKADTSRETGMDLFDGAGIVQHKERNGKPIGPQVGTSEATLYSVLAFLEPKPVCNTINLSKQVPCPKLAWCSVNAMNTKALSYQPLEY